MSHRKVSIASAGNTVNHALEVLRIKGYSVVLDPDATDDDMNRYWATKDGRDFVAPGPVEVLGLVTSGNSSAMTGAIALFLLITTRSCARPFLKISTRV